MWKFPGAFWRGIARLPICLRLFRAEQVDGWVRAARRAGRTFSRPAWARRRLTLTSSKWTRVAAPNSDSATPNSSGKLTASPKLISSVGPGRAGDGVQLAGVGLAVV